MNSDKVKAMRIMDWEKIREIEAQEEKQELAEAIEKLPRDKTGIFINLIKDYTRLESWVESLQEELKQAKSDAYKDAELVKMKSRYEEMRTDYYRGFPISKEEEKAIKEWQTEHEKSHQGGHGAIGGKYTYEFIPTSIGTIGTIKCSCGESFDFQEL